MATMSEHPGITALRRMLQAKRWDDQGGYPGYWGDGEWGFSATTFTVEAEDLNALFALVNVVPDVIVPKGHCRDCEHAIDGRERGYSQPCVKCKRPVHDLFELRRDLRLPETEEAVAREEHRQATEVDDDE